MASEHNAVIDALLERYLHLLDEYTNLRAGLNQLQVAMYQQLARANFTAERGIRYGQDYYDDRMRASRTISVAVTVDKQSKDSGFPQFALECKQPWTIPSSEDKKKSPPEPVKQVLIQDEISDSTDGEVEYTPGSSDFEAKLDVPDAADAATGGQPRKTKGEEGEEGEEEDDTASSKQEEEQSPRPVDPLRWFGFIAPQPLRQTQSHAIRAVEDIVPRLATVSAEMAQVEIEVRRARKKRAKAAVSSVVKDEVVESSVAGTVTA